MNKLAAKYCAQGLSLRTPQYPARYWLASTWLKSQSHEILKVANDWNRLDSSRSDIACVELTAERNLCSKDGDADGLWGRGTNLDRQGYKRGRESN